MRANGTSSYDLLDGAPLAELAKPTAFPNLFLVPSKPELAGAAVELSQRADGERFLAEALAGASGFDFVLLDCPPSLGPLTVNALAAADRVIVPGAGRVLRARGARAADAVDQPDQGAPQPAARVAGVLITMSDGRTKLAADVEARGAAALRRPRLRDGRAALRARRRGAEPRPAGHPLRPPLARRRGLLEGGDGACRTQLASARAVSAAASRS